MDNVGFVFLMASTGADDSETMRVFRCGGADPDGNQPGDLYVTIKVTSIFHSFVPSFNAISFGLFLPWLM